MDFSKSQIPQLSKLTNQLFKKHLIISVPIMIISLICFILITLIMEPGGPFDFIFPLQTLTINGSESGISMHKPPQFFLPKMLQLSYRNSIKSLKKVEDMIIAISQLYENRTIAGINKNKPASGCICIKGSQNQCQNGFMGIIYNIGWHNLLQQLKGNTVDNIFVCDSNVSTCISIYGVNQAKSLSIWQEQFLANLASWGNPIPYYQVETNILYMAIETEAGLRLWVKLQPLHQLVSSLADKLNKPYIRNYKVQVKYPYEDSIAQVVIQEKGGLLYKYLSYGQYAQTLIMHYQGNISQCQQLRTSYCGFGALFVTSSQPKNNFQTPFLQISITYERSQQATKYTNKLPIIIPILLYIIVLKYERSTIKRWVWDNFARTMLITQLYKYAIRDVFSLGLKVRGNLKNERYEYRNKRQENGGKCINISNVLQAGPTAQMFKSLSQLVDKTILVIEQEPQPEEHKQNFKFLPKISEIIQKYRQFIKPIMQQKNRLIVANRFNIQNHINDLFEVQLKTIKQYYVRASQLGIKKQFFTFAYMAILRNTEEFRHFLQEDQTPLPEKLLQFFINMNKNIHETQIIRKKIEGLNGAEDGKQNQINMGKLPNAEKNLAKSQKQGTQKMFCISIASQKNTKNGNNMDSPSSLEDSQVYIKDEEFPAKNVNMMMGGNANENEDSYFNQNNSQYPYIHQINEQLQIRIRINILPKYLAIFKELDHINGNEQISRQIENVGKLKNISYQMNGSLGHGEPFENRKIVDTYAQTLGLDQQLNGLGEIVQNMRYLLNRHNKSIRAINK